MWTSAAALVEPYVRVCLVGPTGSGKTHIAATFPRPIFVFPKNENSKETIRGMDVPIAEVSSSVGMLKILDELLLLQKTGRLKEWGDTVCIESLAHYSEILEMELTCNGQKDMPWGKYNTHFTHMRDVLWQLDAHVVLTGLDKIKTDKHGNVLDHGIRLYGQSGKLLSASCDAIGLCEQVLTDPPSWQVHFRRYGMFDARTRIRGMPQGTYPEFNFGDHISPYLTT